MVSKRAPRSIGTTVLSDALRRPPRRASFPPGPEESPADVRAVRAGEARRVVCYLRAQSGPWPRQLKRGMLEVRGGAAIWRRVGARRDSRAVIDAAGMSVTGARAADHREQRFGSPGNIHLYALVRCVGSAGPLDLVVPIADVPLIRWFFGGQPDVPDSALLDNVIAPTPARQPMDGRHAWTLAVAGCLLILATAALAASVRGMSAWTGPPTGLGFLLILIGVTNVIRARKGKRNAAARPDTQD